LGNESGDKLYPLDDIKKTAKISYEFGLKLSGVADTAESKLCGITDTAKSKFSGVSDTAESKLCGVADTAKSNSAVTTTPLSNVNLNLKKTQRCQ
jgi:hypothetical protein